jgi:hypothetical protein
MTDDMTLTLRVSAFAGCSVEDTARDLCALAGRVGILCEVQFNDVKLWARQGDSPELLAADYYRQIQSTRTHKIAQARLPPPPSMAPTGEPK